jgi:hypothetical protein
MISCSRKCGIKDARNAEVITVMSEKARRRSSDAKTARRSFKALKKSFSRNEPTPYFLIFQCKTKNSENNLINNN